MLKSIRESVRSLLSHSTNDKNHPVGTKRKHNLSEDPEDDDSDVEIVKVEKRRKLDAHTPFWNILNFPSKMASWVRLHSKTFSDQFENVDSSSRRHGSRDSAPKRNGVPSRTMHNKNRGHPEVVVQQPRHGYPPGSTVHGHPPGSTVHGHPPGSTVHGHGHDVSKERGMINIVTNTPHINGERRSSTSSLYRQGNNYSTGLSSIRLKEREEYEKLLKLQSRLSPSPSRTALMDKEPDTPSAPPDSWKDVSILGNQSIFSQPRQSSSNISSVSNSTPQFKPVSTRAFISSRAPDTSESRHRFTSEEAVRNKMASLIARQKQQAERRLPQSQTKPHPQPQETKSYTGRDAGLRGPGAESKTSRSKDSVVVIDDDDDVVVLVPDKGTKSSDVNQPRSTDSINGVSSRSHHKSLDFRDSAYMEPDYIEKFKHSSFMHSEQWRRHVQEEQMKANAYEEKRKAQNLDLEKRLKYQMRIFEEAPKVTEEIFTQEEEEEEVLPELTEAMTKVVRSALGPGPPGEVLSDGFRLQLTRRDIATLAGLNWLNDEVINFYMNMLMERGDQEDMARVYAFNTFFYPKIMQGGHGAVKRWTKKVDIFAMQYILIPVHLGMHWCLCVADIKNKKITYYDSMRGRNKDCLTAVLKYVNDESVVKKQQPINMAEWTLEMKEDNPQQLNGSDCGMFACKYAEYITRGKELTFTQEDMPYFRSRMVYEIITKKLLQ